MEANFMRDRKECTKEKKTNLAAFSRLGYKVIPEEAWISDDVSDAS